MMHILRSLLARWSQTQHKARHALEEDALKHILNCETLNHQPSLESLAGALEIPLGQAAGILERLASQERVQIRAGSFELTPLGREDALRILRAHRLWEHYLAEETSYAAHEWHSRADRIEHQLSKDQADELSARLGHPTHDPHGDPIPTAAGKLPSHAGRPIVDMEINTPLCIVHLEDEPAVTYAKLIGEGLHPGMIVQLSKVTQQRVQIYAGGKELSLLPTLAANIFVVPVPEAERAISVQGQRLSSLKSGQKGRVLGISPAARGPERRRLMDLGIIPGTIITAELHSPMGDPTAYRVRGALIALRLEQADLINIQPVAGE